MNTRLLLVAIAALLLSATQLPAANPVHVIPFTVVGKLIIVEAEVEGQQGSFIVDTGSPDLILNGAYFEGYSVVLEPGSIRDINGHVGPARYLDVKSFSLGTKTFKRELARVIDLEHLEKMRGLNLMGIIGHDFFREVELVLDFNKRELRLIELDRKGNRLIGTQGMENPMDSVRFKLKGHFPFVRARINNKKVRLGIDTGSEVNILGQHVTHRLRDFFFPTGKVQIHGFSAKQTQADKGRLEPLYIGESDYSETEFVSANTLSWQSGSRSTHLDGMLGQPFFRKYTIAINYRKKMLYIWQK